MKKRFKLAADQLRPLAVGHGACYASDKITVEGEPVGFMERAEPDQHMSGWSFVSGTESRLYMLNPFNFAIYDVNTIANYDPDIIRFLNAPPGSEFARKTADAPLLPCEGTTWDGPDGTEATPVWPPPGFPLVDGEYRLTKDWSVRLPEKFARRVEDDALVLWRPGLTLWISVFDNPKGQSQAARLARFRQGISPAATDVREEVTGQLTRLRYHLREDGQDALMSLVFADRGQLQAAIYFDHATDLAAAVGLAESIGVASPLPPPPRPAAS